MKKISIIFLSLLAPLLIFASVAYASTQLGGMDLNAWCNHLGEGTAALASDGQTWTCTGNNQVIDFTTKPTPNCVWQYNVSDAFAVQNALGNPYTWACYTNTATPTPTPTLAITPTPTLTSALTPTPTPLLQSITKLQIINTDTQKVIIDPFITGSNINIGATPHVNINAISNPTKVGSVKFNLDGQTHTENVAPYDDPGDTNGVFNPLKLPSAGTHNLTVTPYSLSNASGTVGTSMKVTFTVSNTPITPTPTPSLGTDDWDTYKYDAKRSNYDFPNASITSSSVANLKLDWNTPVASPSSDFGPNTVSVQPAVVNNVIYYGDWSGNFYAKNVSDGSIIWQRNIGVDTPTTQCNPKSIGIASSATVKNGVVYIGGGDGNLYALNALNGNIVWQTSLGDITKGNFLWDSPVLSNGSIYEGLASFGDCPLVQGKIFRLDAGTGSIQATVKLVPDGCVGAGEWGSPTIDEQNSKVYITTGTQDNSCKVNAQPFVEPYALAMVELDASTLNILGASRIPSAEQGPDSDYGVSPALTVGTINGVSTQLVSAVNKNGRLYVYKRDHISDGPIIDEVLGAGGSCPDCGQGSISTAATTGNNIIYQGGGSTIINGTNFTASIRAINVVDGSFIWEHGLTHALVASPTLLNDVLIVPNGNNLDFLNSTTGALIRRITPAGSSSILDAPVAVARGHVIFGDLNGSFWNYGL